LDLLETILPAMTTMGTGSDVTTKTAQSMEEFQHHHQQSQPLSMMGNSSDATTKTALSMEEFQHHHQQSQPLSSAELGTIATIVKHWNMNYDSTNANPFVWAQKTFGCQSIRLGTKDFRITNHGTMSAGTLCH
jgi:hypothetical protein